MSKRKEFICKECGKTFTGYEYPNHPRIYCSKECKNKAQKATMLGENNPNFGNRWNEKQRLKASIYMKEAMKDPIRRYMAGSANRGKKFSEQIKAKMSVNRIGNKNSFYGKHHTEETRKIIGIKSSNKFLDKEFCDKYKSTMIKLGYWRENIPEQEIYYKLANWKEKMFDKIKDEQQLLKLKELGVFNSGTNKDGVVRDHIFGRRSGYKEGVFPEILRHPCNCQLITNVENIKKKTDKYIDRNDITLDELFDKIENYNGDWDEQELVLELIKKYKNGERWMLKDVNNG